MSDKMRAMESVSDYLSNGFNLSTEDLIPDDVATCSICGFRRPSILNKRLIKSNTGNVADIFRHGKMTCLSCASAFSESRLLTSNIYAEKTSALKPMVSLESASSNRPAWRSLVLGLTSGTECVAIFTSNTKRRLWTDATISTVGNKWRVLFVDGETDRVLTVSHSVLIEQLGIIESLLELGYNKRSISENLFTSKRNSAIPLVYTLKSERCLSELRSTDEFTLALFIAQKALA